jgi:predicted dehydrogenase
VKKLKVGLIGTGGIARSSHIPGFLSIPDECELVWVCDVNPEALSAAKALVPWARASHDYHDVLNDPEIDAVSVTTPNAFHKQPTIDALAAGKHVLCEKPLALNATEAREMCLAARRAGKILMVALQLRFAGPALFMRRYIDSGRMGEIYYARAQALRRRGVPGWGVFIDKEKQGGGPLIDIGAHILDLTLFLMGHPKPLTASGGAWDKLGKDPNIVNPWGEYDRSKFTVEDTAVGLVRFENGAVVVIETSFMANIKDEIFRTELLGTKSGALVKGWGDNPVEIYTEQDRQLFDLTPRNLPEVESAHTAEIQAFVRAVLGGEPSPVPGEHGLVLNAIFDALYLSAETGREQPVDASLA